MNIKLNPNIDDINLRDELVQIHDEYGYYVLLVRTSKMLCSCASREGQQAAPYHEACLGTGRKIRLEKVKVYSTMATRLAGTITDTELTPLGDIYSNNKTFYFEYKVHPGPQNYIYEVSWVNGKPLTILAMYKIQYAEASRMDDGRTEFYTCTTRREISNIDVKEKAIAKFTIRG